MQRDAARPLLEVAGLAAGYRRLQVLWDVDLVIHEHESVVLLGANGAGKDDLAESDHELGRGVGGPDRFRR
jgi:branched-chain amino acid transport system ATP-binding protein